MHVSLTLLGLMLSCVLCGLQKPRPDLKDAAIPREELRYDGKSFEQWRRTLLTELKPARRVEALRALQEFATKGYAAEAAAAAIDSMTEYSPDVCHNLGRDEDFVQAATEVIEEAGAAAQPVLLRALRGQNKNQKLVALRVLASRSSNEDSLAAISQALKDKDAGIRCAVLTELTRVPLGVDEKAIRVLLPSLCDKERAVRLVAVRRLGRVAEESRPIPVPSLVAPGSTQPKVDETLRLMLDGSKDIPGLFTALKDPSADVRLAAVEALGGFTRQSEKVAQAMKDACKDADAAVREAATKALSRSISPDEVESAPVVPPRR